MSKLFNVKELADKILEDFDNLCNALNVRYCLIYGVCLGFYREGGYIPCDDDIDVWIDCDPAEGDKFHVMMERLGELGFDFHSDHRLFRDHIYFDILWGDYPEGILPFVESFDIIVYNNRTYNLPHPVEEYLEWTYGEHWRTPMTKEDLIYIRSGSD